MITVEKLVSLYDMQPHPEGGYFKETYRHSLEIPKDHLKSAYQGNRACTSLIYYLLPRGAQSSFHRLLSDEIWHFYLGDPLTIIEITPQGHLKETIIGQDIEKGHKLQHVIPANVWFGAYGNTGNLFSFVGCTVSPGFDFKDFELGIKTQLMKEFPQHKTMIERLTKN